jgi:Leucine-rich repeat (LRR) protein
LSGNRLSRLGPIDKLSNLKSLRICENQYQPGSLNGISKLSKLQSFAAANNALGKPSTPPKMKPGSGPSAPAAAVVQPEDSIPKLPASMKQMKLDRNNYTSIPPQICAKHLTQLVGLDLTHNNIASIPASIANLESLRTLYLDSNMLVSLPKELGQLSKLKTLSLKSNQISSDVKKRHNADTNPQPIPEPVFTKTALIDLNLHGNPMTYTALAQFDGFDSFLERRKGVKSKGISGGAMTDMDVCGLT